MSAQLLKETIESKAFKKALSNIHFEGNQLTGTLTVVADDRVELVNRAFRRDKFSYSYASSKKTIINIATDRFHCVVNGYKSNSPFDYINDDLGYETYKDTTKIDGVTLKSLNEKISTVFTILDNNEVAGFYDFDLGLSRSTGQVMLVLNLKQIYVKPEYRGSSYWMDLTIAVYTFVSLVFYYLANKLPKPCYYDIYVTADFHSKSDEKIANIIEFEIRAMFDLLPYLSLSKPAFIGAVIADMGY